jgi:hypothetical protein
MKLGACYNLFDGEELLESSITQIREYLDYVTVVYQTTSYYGNKCNSNLLDVLEDLKSKKLIDSILEYRTVDTLPHVNEINKRNIGLELSINNGCSHHMSMDSDEFFIKTQFDNLKKVMSENDYDSSYCKMISYYKSGEYIRIPNEEYYVPLIYKINKNNRFQHGIYCPVEVDPTRRIMSEKFKIFKRDELEMHHFSMVRDNIRSKLDNSSAKKLFVNNIDSIVECYNKWEYPNDVIWPGNPPYFVKIKKVKNLFNGKN